MPPQLSGIDPANPRPKIRREFQFGAGVSLAPNPVKKVLFYGSKTSAGSETAAVIGDKIVDVADLMTRAGGRSNIMSAYLAFCAIPQDVDCYFIASTESGGAAAYCLLTVSGASDANTTLEVTVVGAKIQVAIPTGQAATDTATAIAAALAAAPLPLPGAPGGTLPITCVAAIIGGGPTYGVTITAALKGPDGDHIIGSGASRGIRVRMIGTNTQTVTKGALSAGTTEVDYTAAYTEVANDFFAEQIHPGHATTTVTAADNGIGEGIALVKAQAGPKYGKVQVMHFGLVGTQTQQAAVSVSTGANSVYARFWWDENSDWTPGMLAAHHAAIKRAAEMRHPGANINEWVANDNQVYLVPAKYLKADRATEDEIVAAINTGASPVSHDLGRPKLERHVTSRGLNDQLAVDYRAREGHVTSVVDFAWSTFEARYQSQKQPNGAQDPVGNNPPLPNTTTPGQVASIMLGVIEDLTGPNPLGIYKGPILDPSPEAVAHMRDSVAADFVGGGFGIVTDFMSVIHNIKLSGLIRETQTAY